LPDTARPQGVTISTCCRGQLRSSLKPRRDFLGRGLLYEISGNAYSGTGRISSVMFRPMGGGLVVGGGGRTLLTQPSLLSHALALDGGVATLQSRAWDEAGNVQPTRARILCPPVSCKAFPPFARSDQHFNAITSWAVDARGRSSHCLRLVA